MDDEFPYDSDGSDYEPYEDYLFEDSGSNILSTASSAKVITAESLLAAQKSDLQTVMELLHLKEHHARSVLIQFRWNVEAVSTKLAEEGVNYLLKEAGLAISEDGAANNHNSSTSEIMCGICMDPVSISCASTMDCGHCFCNECWTEHFIVNIREGKSRRIRCMEHKCGTTCDESIIRSLVGAKNPNLMEKFDRSLLESYIEDNKKVKWCPSAPHCGNAILVNEDETCEVECSCGFQFCFSCLSQAHSPCSCLMWELWTRKCQDESETVNWISAHTKPCPKCHKLVEKNGGCNLVQCICRQPFCWLCGEATGSAHTWQSIEGHSCGRYKEDYKTRAQRAEIDLHRYLHYYKRYKAHLDSFDLENKMRENITASIASADFREIKMEYPGWLLSGLCRLSMARQVILNSYAFAFYMFGDMFSLSDEEKVIKQNLFEDQQQQLEANVERLSGLISKPFDEFVGKKSFEIKTVIIHQSGIVDTICKNLFVFIENDLLQSLPVGSIKIAPYRSTGIEKASELPGDASSEEEIFDKLYPSNCI